MHDLPWDRTVRYLNGRSGWQGGLRDAVPSIPAANNGVAP
jgi:hypothetical protein